MDFQCGTTCGCKELFYVFLVLTNKLETSVLVVANTAIHYSTPYLLFSTKHMTASLSRNTLHNARGLTGLETAWGRVKYMNESRVQAKGRSWLSSSSAEEEAGICTWKLLKVRHYIFWKQFSLILPQGWHLDTGEVLGYIKVWYHSRIMRFLLSQSGDLGMRMRWMKVWKIINWIHLMRF